MAKPRTKKKITCVCRPSDEMIDKIQSMVDLTGKSENQILLEALRVYFGKSKN